MQKTLYILQVLGCLTLLGKCYSQDIETISKSKNFEFSGNLSAGFSFNSSSNTIQNLAPLSYRLSFNPTITIKGFAFPFQFTYVDSDFSYGKPTLRLGFNPKYKWAQAYTGKNSFTLSPYTLSGQNIEGYGLHLTPKKFEFLAFYGKVQNFNIQRDTLGFGRELLPSYERKVIGTKIGFQVKSFRMQLTGARITDELSPINMIPAGLRPKENLVVGTNIETNITKYFRMGVDVGVSVLTQDREANFGNDIIDEVMSLKSSIPITINKSTRLSYAGSSFANVTIAKQIFGVKYRRVAPFFESLGLFFVNNDYEEIAFTSQLRLFKGKARLKGTFGKQTNNLNGLKARTSSRTIGSLQGNFQLSKTFSVATNYSNNQQDHEAGIIDVSGLPTYGQVSENLSVSPRYIISKEKSNQSYMLLYSKFGFKRLEDGQLAIGATSNQNINGNYAYNNKKGKWGLRLGANYFVSDVLDNNTTRYGLTLGYNKTFKEKLRLNISILGNRRESDRNEAGFVNTNRLGLSYQVAKKQSLRVSLIQNNGIIQNNRSTNRFRANLSYGLNF